MTEPVQTKWAVPIVFAQKKNGTLRFYVAYRRLEALTKQVVSHTAYRRMYQFFRRGDGILNVTQ